MLKQLDMGSGDYVDLLDRDPPEVARRLLASIGMTVEDLERE